MKGIYSPYNYYKTYYYKNYYKIIKLIILVQVDSIRGKKCFLDPEIAEA